MAEDDLSSDEFIFCESWKNCEIYRNMKMGIALRKSLKELVDAQRLTEVRADRVLRRFDLEVKNAFREERDYGGCLRVKAHSLVNYRGDAIESKSDRGQMLEEGSFFLGLAIQNIK
nr:uncharacterized protein LOC123765137 isoform X2 [Procambarus clarkii]